MNILKFTLLTAIFCLGSVSIFSQNKPSKEDQKEMSYTLDQLTPSQVDAVLMYAAKLVQEQHSKEAITELLQFLSPADQKKIFSFAKRNKKPSPPKSIGKIKKSTDAPNQSDMDSDILTSLEFDNPVFDFGEINEGDKVQHIYTYTNTGTEPLIIKNAKGSCGCTVPKWQTAPLMPGETGEITVEFNSRGKSGNQSKRITITANTSPTMTFLTISGVVNK